MLGIGPMIFVQGGKGSVPGGVEPAPYHTISGRPVGRGLDHSAVLWQRAFAGSLAGASGTPPPTNKPETAYSRKHRRGGVTPPYAQPINGCSVGAGQARPGRFP